MSLINNFSGAQEIFALDYPCSIVFNDMPYPSLWHSMIAAMTTNHDLRQALSDNRFIMHPQIIKDLWEQVDDMREYRLKVVDMLYQKYAPYRLLPQLLTYMSEDDELSYPSDPSRIVAKVTKFIRKGKTFSESIQALDLQD